MPSLSRTILAMICFLLIANVYPSQADTPSPKLEDLESQQNFKKLEDTVNEARDILIKSRNNFEAQCMKAFGKKTFCSCIADKSPLISFTEYVSMTTATKEQVQHASIGEDDRKLIDATRKARDICVTSTSQ